MKIHDIIDSISGGPGPDASYEDRQIWMDFEMTVYQLEMLVMGLAYRRAGFVWFPPLCHDGLDY